MNKYAFYARRIEPHSEDVHTYLMDEQEIMSMTDAELGALLRKQMLNPAE